MNDGGLIDRAIDALGEKVAAERKTEETRRIQGHLEEDLSAVLGDEIAIEIAERGRAPGLKSAYRAEFETFKRFASVEVGLPHLPANPALVAAYIVERGADDADLELVVGAISAAHKLAGLADPTIDVLPAAAVRYVERRRADETQGQVHH